MTIRLILGRQTADARSVLRWRRRHIGFLLAGLSWLAFLGAAGTASASGSIDNVTYQGGPVAHSMTGVLVDWGSSINSMYTNSTSGDPGLIQYLAAQSGSTTDIGGVIAQYMDSSGQNAANHYSYGQQYEITPSVTGTTISDPQIQTELAAQINAGHLPSPTGDGLSTIYLVLFPNGDVECVTSTQCSANAPTPSDQAFCAYHSSFQLSSGANVLYAVLPDNTSGNMSTECGQSPTQLNNQTSFLSHEWSETISDPLGNAWWVYNAGSPADGNEIGDTCNQIETNQGGWTVQELWSNLDSNCVGGESAYAAPTASFLAPNVAPPNQQVDFDASSSSDPSQDNAATGTGYSISPGIANYQWNWGDGSSSSTATATATHTYATTGNYEVSLTVTDNLGFTSTVTQAVSISTTGTPNPSVTTAGVGGISAGGATVEGAINPYNQSTQYQFVYGTSPASLSDSTALVDGPSGQTSTPVSATLSGLSPSTTYYYQLDVLSGGQTYAGGVESFATNAAPPPPQTPTVATGSASAVSQQSAVLTGMINPGGSQQVSYRFSYGTSPGNLSAGGNQSASATGTSSQPVSTIVSGLAPDTTYYFRLDADLGGQAYSGTIASFTTHAAQPGASTGAVRSVTSTAATVTGTVSPAGAATSYLVEYGTTGAFGHSSPAFSAGAGRGNVPVTITLAGLRSRTRYYFRVVAMSAGGTGVGGDRTFTTLAPLAPAPRFSFTLTATGKLRIHFRCSKACSAHFSVTLATPGLVRFTPVAVTLAHATGTSRARGRGTVTIRLSAAIRARMRHGALKVKVVGYAVSRGSARSAPLAKPATIRR